MMPHEALDNLLAGCYPSDTHARCDHLGEGIEAHDATVRVHGEQGGDEGAQELDVGGWRWRIGCEGGGIGLHLEEVVRLVFKDVEVVLLRYVIESSAAPLTLRCPGWILSGRDRV